MLFENFPDFCLLPPRNIFFIFALTYVGFPFIEIKYHTPKRHIFQNLIFDHPLDKQWFTIEHQWTHTNQEQRPRFVGKPIPKSQSKKWKSI